MRSINSPGVQIIETDLSQYQTFGGGTRIFLPGFASQGPSDEVIQVTTVSEFEQIYGQPQNAAERYFYYSAKEILNSPATLFTTRLPYGSGYGEGFANQYSALFFPVASAYSDPVALSGSITFHIGEPKFVNLSLREYEDILENNITWTSLASVVSANPVAASSTNTTFTSAGNTLQVPAFRRVYADATALAALTGDFTYEFSAGDGSWNKGTRNITSGFVICNASKTALNEVYEGYYLSVTDNAEFARGSDFTAVTQFYSLTGSDQPYYVVPSSKYEFALSGSRDTTGGGSVSETIESAYDWTLNQQIYDDIISINLFKVRRSIYDPTTLTISPVENHLGSLNSRKRQLAPIGGIPRTFFIKDIVNNGSPNLEFVVHPDLASNKLWASDNPPLVRMVNKAKALYPHSVWMPTYLAPSNKQIGNLVDKVQRVLSLIETPESIPLDIVCDAGLSTIYTTTSSGGIYDDTTYIAASALGDSTNELAQRFRTITGVFNTFVANTRKDSVFISDPVRQIFVVGENTKTISQRQTTFTQQIFNPLKSLYGSINSSYSATYGNWAKVYDVFTDRNFWMPFSACAAAVYARTDANTQPWFAPAGLNRGSIPNLVDIAINPNQKQRDSLYTISINPVVFFSGDGYTIFGQKTLQNKPSAFDRINVRRLFLTLEKATQQSLRYFVFEPNTEFTRTRLKNTINPIFELARNTEGLYDFLIVCDERNNTPDRVDRNELAVDIYIKPVKAAEFILVNFIATRTGQNFSELI
jgi:hypothetical protein